MRLGDVLYTRWLVKGVPRHIPSDAAVTVRELTHFTRTGKQSKRPHADGSTRVRVEYMGHDYWVDAEALSAEKTSYSANPRKDNVELRKGTRVRTQYRGVDVRGRIHLLKKDGYVVVILDEADADATLVDAVEVPVSRVTVESHDNPAQTGGVTLVLAGLAAAGLAWLLFRPKPAQAAPATATLPSLVPETQPPLPPPPTKAPELPKLNCAGKVFVTYKFKDAPPVINVFRRLTTWQQGLTPDQGGLSFEERNWASPDTSSFFNIGVLDAQGWLNTTPFENHYKDAQMLYVTRRYLAEAWVETTDGWCLAATDTNYEPWSVG